jgi:hypothetical protein
MNEVAKDWVKALRSGNYDQTTGKLTDGDGAYCCLGVLCDLYSDTHPDSFWQKSSEEYPFFFPAPETEGDFESLPDEVRDWAKMKSMMGTIDDDGTSLASLNDDGIPFEGIANAIEENEDILFTD